MIIIINPLKIKCRMKKLNVNVIAVIIVACSIVSCSKDDSDSNENSSSGATSKNGIMDLNSEIPDHDSSMIADSVDILWLSKVNDLPTSGISVFNDEMLHFDNFNTFHNFMDELGTKATDALDAWISDFGNFPSLRTHYEELSLDQNIDDIELNEERFTDCFFEAVISEDLSIRIADTVYRLSEDIDMLFMHLVEDGQENPESFKGGDLITSTCDHPDNWHRETCEVRPNWCTEECKITGEKEVLNTGYYSSITHASKYYERNWLGKWKPADQRGVTTFKDHYYNVIYNLNGNAPALTIGYETIASVRDAPQATRYIIHKAPVNSSDIICVEEFGRTHNWALNVNYWGMNDLWNPVYWHNDTHCDNWY